MEKISLLGQASRSDILLEHSIMTLKECVD